MPVFPHRSPGVYNVRDYGATGNGSTDDAAAIQRALDLASSTNPGSQVFIPTGTYKVSSELEIKGSVHIACSPTARILRGSSSMQYILKNFNSSFAPTLYGGRGDIVLTGGIWDADGANISAACTVLILAHADNILVQGVTVRNVPDWHGLEVNACRKVKVRDCTFEGFRVVTAGRELSEAVQLDLATGSGALPGIGAGAYDNTPCADVLVEGCTVRGLGSLGSYGRLCGSHNAVNGNETENVRVIGNYAESLNDYGVSAWNWNNAVVSGNTFVSCNGGVLIELPASMTTDIERFTIADNQFISAGTQNNGTAVLGSVIATVMAGTGVIRSVNITGNQIKTWANTAAAISIATSSDVICSNNSIRGASAGASVAILADNSSLGVYLGNKIDTVAGGGIVMQNASSECVVSNSVINAAADGITLDASRCVANGNVMRITSASKRAIAVTANGSDAMIAGNFLRLSVATPTAAGIDVAAAMDIMIQANVIKGWGATEGSTGPVNRGGTLDPAMSTSQVTTTNVNSYE
jgi:polygalacturonase